MVEIVGQKLKLYTQSFLLTHHPGGDTYMTQIQPMSFSGTPKDLTFYAVYKLTNVPITVSQMLVEDTTVLDQRQSIVHNSSS